MRTLCGGILAIAAAAVLMLVQLPILALGRAARLLDLCGADGRPSFSKLVVATVLVAAIVGHAIPTPLATLVVCASFGSKVLLALIRRTAGAVQGLVP